MSRSTFRVLFYLKRNAPKKNGLVPVMCRITVNGKISQFSCKLDVEEKLWNVSLGRMSGRSIVAQEANLMLDKIRIGINKAYQEITNRDGYVSAEKVRNAFLGMEQNHRTLLAVFRQHNEDYAKQVGKMKSQRSYEVNPKVWTQNFGVYFMHIASPKRRPKEDSLPKKKSRC